MDTTVSSLPLHCHRAPPRPPLSRLRLVLPARYPSLPSSPPHPRRLGCGSRLHHPSRPVSPLRIRRRGPNAATGAAVAFSGWANGRRRRGRRVGGLDKATVERWASILLLAGSIQRLLVMQPLDVLVALLEHRGGATIGGGGGSGDRALGLLRRGLSRVGRGKKAKGTWRRAVVLAIKVASAVAAAAAIWLLLSGKRLI